ncbi:MAG: hypothetical protein ABEJ84_03800 [Halodesulfurarchaeum sp.]
MDIIEIHVDRLDVQTVPKVVLFGGSEGADRDEPTTKKNAVRDRDLPVSPARVLAVSIGAMILAFVLARLKGIVDEKLALHC